MSPEVTFSRATGPRLVDIGECVAALSKRNVARREDAESGIGSAPEWRRAGLRVRICIGDCACAGEQAPPSSLRSHKLSCIDRAG